MTLTDFFKPFGLFTGAKKTTVSSKKPTVTPVDDRPKKTALPNGRSSTPDFEGNSAADILGTKYSIVSPSFLAELIPIIRALSQLNPDVSQALHNIVSLGNSGHKVFFDRKVPEEQVDRMRNHLKNKRKNWAPGQAGMDGQINKMFAQVLISGALSNEWVPNNTLTGIQANILINPENIVFKLAKDKITYLPYQRIRNSILRQKPRIEGDLIPLNTNTYKYYALNGDGEMPYGIPPYAPVVQRISTQNKMNDNIDFIMDIMGLVGFLEVLVTKPDEDGQENETDYEARLQDLLTQARANMLTGMKDGVVSGFKEDHEFEFHSAAKNFKDVVDLYKNNELQIASALKQDAALWGRDYGTSEAKAGITFMKMISELKNIQNLIKTNLEFGYSLELMLAGYTFEYLTVQFNRSTITDDLKYQQAEEYKIKNIQTKMVLGMINQDQAADELGYETPSSPKPMVPWEMLAGKGAAQKPDPAARATRKGQKGKSAKVSKDKKKPAPKSK